MHIENLKLTNFKNYVDEEIDLCDNVNCFVGNNGNSDIVFLSGTKI